MTGKYLNVSDWSKNQQWFCLNRSHVKLILKDTYLKKRFSKWCNGRFAGTTVCAPDEHYFATTLYVYKLGNETDCVGELTAADFRGGTHPYTYKSNEIKPDLIQALRIGKACKPETAIKTSLAILDRKDSCLGHNSTTNAITNKSNPSRNWVIARGYKPLNASCNLLARKFSRESIEETLRAVLHCKGGAMGYWC
eukprot:g4659.t1